MKLRQSQNSIQQRIFKPNPPTAEAIKRAKFRDKTFHWNSSVRSGNQRTIER